MSRTMSYKYILAHPIPNASSVDALCSANEDKKVWSSLRRQQVNSQYRIGLQLETLSVFQATPRKILLAAWKLPPK